MGFTLVELMVVVALMSVIAAIAILRMRKQNLQTEVDEWSNRFIQSVNQARRRAVSTHQTYMLDVRETTMQWCLVDPATVTANVTTQTACPPATAGLDQGPLERARPGATFVKYANGVDDQGAGAVYTPPIKTNLSGASALVFFGPNGTVSSSYLTATASGQVATGFTIYAEPTAGESHYKEQKRQRVVVLGPSGRTRLIANWQ